MAKETCALKEGQQYSLSTKAKSNKSLLFVKLTDSALHSIEAYLQQKGNSLSKPTIKFQKNNGTIALPLNSNEITYRFTLSNMEADRLSSFHCLQHTANRSFTSLGPMNTKMQIRANEDSYEQTKCKMAAADQEQKSLCTKEIKPNKSQLSRKVNIIHVKTAFPTNIGQKRKSLCIGDRTVKYSNKTQKQPIFNGNGKISNALVQQPIRKRIIHILAVRPYKKPELLLRLKKEGIIDKDRINVPDILAEVGALKGQMYTLSSHLWNEIEDNWKFYTKEELEIIRRKKQQFLKSSDEISKEKHIQSDPVFVEPPQSKKRRLSHFNKVADKIEKTDSSVHNVSVKIKSPVITNGKKFLFSPLQMNGVGFTNGICSIGLTENGRNHVASTECNGSSKERLSIPDSPSEFDCSCTESSEERPSIPDSPSEFDYSEHMKKYQKIVSDEQRAQYATDFESQYTEYLRLHAEMKDISQTIDKHLRSCEEGSQNFKRARLEIRKLCKSTVQSSEYIKKWKKFKLLKSKLSHIKKIVMEYDSEKS